MQVSVEKTSDLERRMTVQVPSEKIESKISGRLNELRKQVRLKGFRPGKVPMNVINQRYGAQVREEILQETMQQTLQEAIGQESLRVAGVTKIEPSQTEQTDADFEYVAHL
ncbi:MAG TPA: trigger factor family protein, partial [Wenzhouxiangella sp.]